MRAIFFALFLVSTVTIAEDARQLVKLPAAAQESLRQEMLDNLVAVNEVLLLRDGKVAQGYATYALAASNPAGLR